MIADETTSTSKPTAPSGEASTEAPLDPREPALRDAFGRLRDAIDELERAVLLALSTAPRPPTTVPLVRRDVMKPREYAEHMRVNVRKVHGWIHSGMPHFLVEGRIRIRVADADAWLESKEAAKKASKTPANRKTVQTRRQKTADKDGKVKEPRSKSKSKRTKQA